MSGGNGTESTRLPKRPRGTESAAAAYQRARDEELDVHLILDNYGAHKTVAVKRWLLRHPRYSVHFTPTYSSWINLVERFFAALTEQQLRRGTHRSTHALEQAIRDYLAAHNADANPFVWTKSADDIIQSVGRFIARTNQTGH